MKTPVVAIVGKPNVGKSTFFNRLAGARVAITCEEEGTTRDRIFRHIVHPQMDFLLVDTAGLRFDKPSGEEENLEVNIQKQTRLAIEEADLIFFMVNHHEALTAQDYQATELLRVASNKKPVLLVINKCDHSVSESELASYYELGLGDPYPVSAVHNTGIDPLVRATVKILKERHFLVKKDPQYKKAEKQDRSHPQVALVGRTSVGKSSLINALLNEEKRIVSPTPGTTRDSADSLIRHQNKDYNFIDTAGLRKRGKISQKADYYSFLRALTTIDLCDVALLVLDSSRPIARQDQQIADMIVSSGKGLILLINKWDIKKENSGKDEDRRARYIRTLQRVFPFLSWAPLIFVSAVTKKNLRHIFEQIDGVCAEREKRIPTARLNQFVEMVLEARQPPGTGKGRPKLLYATQAETRPPRFVFFVNKKKNFQSTYLRYLENSLREQFGFTGTSIGIKLQERRSE